MENFYLDLSCRQKLWSVTIFVSFSIKVLVASRLPDPLEACSGVESYPFVKSTDVPLFSKIW